MTKKSDVNYQLLSQETDRLPKSPKVRAIILAAEQLFFADGYDGTPIRQVASKAEVTIAGLYYHYPSKQDLLFGIMQRFMKWSVDLTTKCVAAGGQDPTSRLENAVRSHVYQHATHRVPSFVVNNEIRRLDADNRAKIIAQRDSLESIFASAISEGIASGEFTTAYPREATRAVITAGTAVASWYNDAGELSPTDVAERYVTLALDTLGAVRE